VPSRQATHGLALPRAGPFNESLIVQSTNRSSIATALLAANLGEIQPALTSMDACTTFVSGVFTVPETVYGPMLDDQANVEHYYCSPRRNGGLEWRREAKRLNLLGARETRTG
jgi:hypothetical protein